MFKFCCPYCHDLIEAEDEWEGQTSKCPNCGMSIAIERPKGPQLRRANPSAPSPKLEKPQKKLVCELTFWLGFFFNLIGMLIAAVIEGGEGASKALKGILWLIIVLLATFVLVGFAMMIFD